MLVTAANVPIPFSPYPPATYVDRETLIDLLAEALMHDSTFRPRRRHWAADADRCRLAARICAAGLVEHLYRRGIRWSRPAAAASNLLMFRHTVLAALMLSALARPSFADVTGPATVVDGDTLVVAGQRVRLQGIDAPELECAPQGGQDQAAGLTVCRAW